MTQFLVALVGVNFRDVETRALVKDHDLFETFPLRLERELDNEYDANAVRVIADTGFADSGPIDTFVGYVERAVAAEIAPLLDDGAEPSIEVLGWLSALKPHLQITFP
jgi:hypothetical protein